MWVADEVLEMPLHGVNPALQVETVLYGVVIVGIADGRVNVVFDIIVLNGLVKDLITLLCK